MYESFFGFKETPFRLSADEKFRYAHKNYLRASAYLAYALQQSEGFVMITGQPGSGKTTLVRDVISEIDHTKFQALNLVTSQLQAEELLRKVALEYGLPAETYNKATLLTSIHKHISELHEQGKRSILFLDEAQNLSVNGLEELRLLSNLQQGKHSLLQIVLIGHDELRELVLAPGMEHIQQRLIAICQIKPMSVDQTREYITHRLSVVGWQGDPNIEEEVFPLIHQAAQGVPRKINHLMSRLLLFASLEEKHQLADEDALTIIEELVDEQRITLVDGETYEAFVDRYQTDKQQRLERQPDGAEQDTEQDVQFDAPLKDDIFKHEDQQQRRELIASTNLITENLLSAIDQSAQEYEDAWDMPDTDWCNWESDLVVKKEPALISTREGLSPSYNETPLDDDAQDSGAQDGGRPISLPSADEIWKDGIDSVVMDSITLDSLNDELSSLESLKHHEAAKLPSIEDEHQWGGVWWMSSENRNQLPDRGDRFGVSEKVGSKTQTTSEAEATNTISVDENLSMPSVWVDGCPDAASMRPNGNPHAFRSGSHKRPSRNRSLFHVTSLITLGLLVFLVLQFFPNQITGYWQEVVTRFSGAKEPVRQVVISEGYEEESSTADLAGERAPEQSLIESVESEPAEEEPLPEMEMPLRMGDPDVSSFKKIALATRYSVYFDFNKSAIPTQYIPLLKSVQYKMLLEENSFLRITGYADTQGNHDYNYRLSLKRAEEVKRFFSKRGVAGDRLQVDAVGAVDVSLQSEPESTDSESERRRVEVILFPN